MYVLTYKRRDREDEQFFGISEQAERLVKEADRIVKETGWVVIKWGAKKRTARVGMKSTPDWLVGRFKISKVKPL